MAKLYTSKAWLTKRYVVEKKSVAQMAAEAKCAEQTILNWLLKYELVRNSRTWRKK